MNSMFIKILCLFLVIVFSSFMYNYQKEDIEYVFQKANEDLYFYGGLSAKYKGKTYNLINLEANEYNRCIKGVLEADFDNDGFKDILIENILGCGGNGMPYNSYEIGYYDEINEEFKVTEDFGMSSAEPEILNLGKYKSIKIENIETEQYGARYETYILKEGEMILTNIQEELSLPSKLEMIASEFTEDEMENGKYLKFDLDSDGIEDQIIGEYWHRWGSMIWSVKFSNGKIFESHSGYDRVGILESKTNGVNDIICGGNDIWLWNGNEYVSLSDNE